MIKTTYTKSKQAYKVTFELAAEQIGEKRDLRVLGSFNDWSWADGVALKFSKNKYTGHTELPAGHYQFRYLADEDEWVNDPSVEGYTESGYGTKNCCLSLDQVEEKTSDKKAPQKKEATKKDTVAAKPAKASAAKKKETAQATAKPAKSKTKQEVAKKATSAKSTKKSAPADDLKRIEGIGPKIAGLLKKADISSFADLAKASDKKLADVLQEAGARFRLAKPKTWQEQAKLAAAGKNEELKNLQDELKGGVRK
ncbi:DUF4332 domain-containing protein [Neolewinella antarctica]|uniref:Flap endonuclease-1-like 5' DNA nuclease n=1 Tax=Neolewinella antarctica TaxID=442734 RepID=A0ABX0X5S8_9BACT|nr:DUF4332 domain-containing protein [Neolewinella antarctica]NJC24555.1 putative flap endonuclease-1-like 5' DNA nuclease [Neolewinella antarctica]